MSLKALVFCACILMSVTASPMVKRSGMSNVDIISLEEPCVRQGGICTRLNDCAAGDRVQYHVSLCPAQASLGVVCCYV